MKKLKNKFILLTIIIISAIISSQVYIAYSFWINDTNSYVKLIKGKALLNETFLSINGRYLLDTGDKIITQDASLAVIEWWDGSLTRLGDNTKISIEHNQISKDYTDIKISFDLLAGKTWSQVISFIWKDSSFTQNFKGIEAWVRGTIFDVDLTQDFLRVTDHLVTLTQPDGNIIQVSQWDIINLKSFSLVELSKFIRDMEDRAWSGINIQLDEAYTTLLQERLQSDISDAGVFLFILDFFSPKYRIIHAIKNSDKFSKIEELISSIDEWEKKEVYDGVLSKYQAYNFVRITSYDAYKRKLFFKRALVLLTNNEQDIERLMQTSWYDISQAAKQKVTLWVEETLNFLTQTSKRIPDVKFTLPELNFDYLPEGLKKQFEWSLQNIRSYLNIKNINIPTNLDDLDNWMQQFLDTTVGGFIQNISQ